MTAFCLHVADEALEYIGYCCMPYYQWQNLRQIGILSANYVQLCLQWERSDQHRVVLLSSGS